MNEIIKKRESQPQSVKKSTSVNDEVPFSNKKGGKMNEEKKKIIEPIRKIHFKFTAFYQQYNNQFI